MPKCYDLKLNQKGVKPVNLISTKQVIASSERSIMLSSADVLLAREFILYAAESMQQVIDWEIHSGRQRPIVDAMCSYVADARDLLKRMR